MYIQKKASTRNKSPHLDQNAVYAAYHFLENAKVSDSSHLVNADSSTAEGLSYTRFTHGESSVAEGRRRTGAGFVGDGWSVKHLLLEAADADVPPTAAPRGGGHVLGSQEGHARGTASALHCHRCDGCRECATRAGSSCCTTSCCFLWALGSAWVRTSFEFYS